MKILILRVSCLAAERKHGGYAQKVMNGKLRFQAGIKVMVARYVHRKKVETTSMKNSIYHQTLWIELSKNIREYSRFICAVRATLPGF